MQPGGGRWIRTTEGVSQQIYSLPPLAAWVSLRIPVSRTSAWKKPFEPEYEGHRSLPAVPLAVGRSFRVRAPEPPLCAFPAACQQSRRHEQPGMRNVTRVHAICTTKTAYSCGLRLASQPRRGHLYGLGRLFFRLSLRPSLKAALPEPA